MWPFYLVVPGFGGGELQHVRLYVQDYDAHNADVLHLDARMSRSQFRSHTLTLDDVRRLFESHHDTGTGSTRPLLTLNPPYMTLLTVDDAAKSLSATMIGGNPIVLQPVFTQSDGWVVLTAPHPGSETSIRMWARETSRPGSYAVWRINCTVHASRLMRGTGAARRVSSARMHHLLSASLARERAVNSIDVHTGVAERHYYDPSLVGAAAADDDEPMPLERGRPEHFVQTCLSWSGPTMSARLPSDGVMLRALSVGYSVEAGHSLLHSAVGQRLLHANTDPSAAIAVNPVAWINDATETLHGDARAPRAWNDGYRRDAQLMNQRLVAGLLDRVQGWFASAQGKMPPFLAPFMPGEKTIAALRSLDVKKAASAAKSAASSKTMAAVVTSMVKRDSDVPLLQAWGAAVLGDAKLDDTEVGSLLVENAPAVQEGAIKMFNKFKSFAGENVTPGKLRDYADTFRKLIGDSDMRDGVLQLAAAASKAGKYVAANSGKVVDAAKATGAFVAKHSDTIVAAGKTAATAAGAAAKFV